MAGIAHPSPGPHGLRARLRGFPVGALRRWPVLLLVLFRAPDAGAQAAGPYPEVELEARTLEYYRPSLLFALDEQDRFPRELFRRRLRMDLELAGTLRLVEGDADGLENPAGPAGSATDADSSDRAAAPALEEPPTTVLEDRSPPELPGFHPPGETGEGILRLGLRQLGDSLAFAEWELSLNSRNALEEADRLAEELLLLLTGYRPPFRSRLLYVEPEGSGGELLLADFFGDEFRPLSRSGSSKYSPCWSPDGGWICYVVLREGSGADLFTASLKGGKAQLLLGGSGPAAAPAWSPDGAWIACAAAPVGNTDIYLLPAPRGAGGSAAEPARGSSRRLTFSPGIDTSPAWSPDGRHLAFCSDRSGTLQIYRCDADGLETERLSFQGTSNDCPAWSPDGEWIAFVSRERLGYQVFQVRPDGSDLVRLTSEPGNHFDPAWSPDGQQLAYTWRGEVWIMLADGTGRRRLSRRGGSGAAWEPLPPTVETANGESPAQDSREYR